MKIFVALTLLFISIHSVTYCQVYSNKEVGKKNEQLSDSLKNSEYPYILPIWGDKATKKGFNLPYSAGISVQYLSQKQDLVIENLSVGFNNQPMYDLSNVIRFNEAISEASGWNLRPDVWVLPFLNVYGILAAAKPSTTVGFGVWVPDSTNTWREVFNMKTTAELTSQTLGFGVTPTIGLGGGWMALDMNFTWTDVSALDKPVYSFIFDPRFGKSFRFNQSKKERNLNVWVGAFRWMISSETNGSLPLSEVIESGELGSKVEAGFAKVADAEKQVDAWWSGLSSTDQRNPVNTAKYEAANKALAAAGNFLTAAQSAVNNVGNSSVQYSLEKRPEEKWNFLIGGQYQHNKHWMLRAEYGFLGTRNQVIAGLQYRFGL